MQFMYVLTLIVMLCVTAGSIAQRQSDEVTSESNGIAMQFALWHRAAFDRCSKATCVGGTVSPTEIVQYMPVQMSSLTNSPYGKGWFTSRYDPATKLLVSHMTTGFRPTQSTSFTTISAAMVDGSYDGQTSSSGYWNGSSVTPLRPLPLGSVTSPTSIIVPTGFMGVAIPVGSPIIASRI